MKMVTCLHINFNSVNFNAHHFFFFFLIHFKVPSAPQDIKAIPASNTKIIVSWLPPLNMNGEIVSLTFYNYNIYFDTIYFNYYYVPYFSYIKQIGYTFYMLSSEGGSHEGIHKKVLGPNVEVHEAHRQVWNPLYIKKVFPSILYFNVNDRIFRRG